MIRKRKQKGRLACTSSLLLLFILLGALTTGCTKAKDEEKLQVVASIFPIYDWAREVIGQQSDGVELTLIVNNGTDLHSYQPSAADIVTIATCDVFLYVGGKSDSWVTDVLQNAGNSTCKVVNLLSLLGDEVVEEALTEGMQHEHDEEGQDEHEENAVHEGHDEIEYDEHVWLSLQNAAFFVQEICDILKELDEKNAAIYQQNSILYAGKLKELETEYQKTVDNAQTKTLLFCDRFPFRYLTEDYGIEYYAAFPGCSAETEASFATIAFLTEKLEERKLSAVITIEGSNQDLAKTVIQNTKEKNQKILVLDSLQSIGEKDIKNGASYLKAMEKNLTVLQEALQ